MVTKQPKLLRPDEEFVISILAEYYCGTWRPGENPPDAYLTADGTEVAVEITTLVQHVNDSQRGWIPINADFKFLLDVMDELDKELSGRIPEDRTVMLEIHPPVQNPPRFKRGIAQQITTLANQYSSAELPTIICGNHIKISVLSGHRGSKQIIGVGAHQNSNRNILENAREILFERVAEKAKGRGRIRGPSWLALRNRYPIADVETYRQAWELDWPCHGFEKVLLVCDDGSVCELDLRR